jgi:hypothetical protein
VPIAERYGVPIIEDAAEALGATHGSRAAGSFGAMAVFSFNGNKIITTSGGGALVGLRPDMSEEEIAALAAQAAAQLEAQEAARAARKAARPKTRRALQAEAKAQRFDQMRKHSAGALYKRLAKALHPDLERDAEARERKVALMQELTAAFARNDLHTLLRLEHELNGDAAQATQVADETLDAYVELLKRQAGELEAEYAALRLDPRYSVLWSPNELFGMTMLIDGPTEVARLDLVIASMEEALGRMAAAGPLGEARDLVREFKAAERIRTRPQNFIARPSVRR